MELTRKVTYEIKHSVPEMGDLVGKIEILTSFGSSTPDFHLFNNKITLFKHTGLGVDEELCISYDKVPNAYRFDVNNAKFKGSFTLPETVPVTKDGWGFQRSEQYFLCINIICEVLDKVCKEEYLGLGELAMQQ